MKTKELKTKEDKDLEKLLSERRKALRLFRFGIAGSKAKNVKEGQAVRKTIARILTELAARRATR